MNPNLPPHVVLMQLIDGVVVSRCITLAAEFGIADLLAEGPREVSALAASTSLNQDALYRILRALAAVGVFSELPERRFENNPVSEMLMSNRGPFRSLARWMGHPVYLGSVVNLDFSLRTGKPTVEKDNPGMKPFEMLVQHPDALAVFSDAMTGFSLSDGAAIRENFDFSRFRRIVDVGGGHGALAAMMSSASPEATVTVFDLPHVIEGTAERVKDSGGRVNATAGNFLESVPGPTDLFVLKWILHDWSDEAAIRILSNCRKSLAADGRVLVCEMLVEPGPEGVAVRLLDIEMMAGAGGRERTEAEFSALFEAAGFKLERVIPTHTLIRLLEASPR